MFLEYSGNTISWLLEFAKRSTFVIIKSCTFSTKTTFPSRTFQKIFSFKMFPGCPEHCNAEGTLSEYSRNTAWRLGIFVTPKITYSYWFITILIFSILKMIIFSLYLKISSIISLIAFFPSLKTFLIFLSSQSLISSFFSIKKMFLMSNCGINCFFFSFF